MNIVNKNDLLIKNTDVHLLEYTLNKSNIRVYNLMFDGDEAGEKGIREFLANIRKDVIVNIIRLPKGKDINDLSYDEVENLINKALNLKF